ncbi:MAG: hypothetical protein JW878_02235 [Methanomicrobia archaeon]|nr:hypothetical protein [Methanomicrobia archaeon]
MEFIKYRLTSDMLCMGERIKKGTFRPTIRTIPYTQITGALKAVFGDNDIHAVGHLVEDKKHNKVDYLTYSPRDRGIETSKLPLTIEFLTGVLGSIYIVKNEVTKDFAEEFEIRMGAMKSRGFGLCTLKKLTELNDSRPERDRGVLNTRIPEEHLETFGVSGVIKPVYGFLFKPLSDTSGVYVRSLFEGSEIAGPKFLLEHGGK